MAAVKCILVLLALGYPFSSEATFTGVWTPCPKADPNLGECLSNSLQKFIPVLKKGIPQYGIPELDPLTLGSLDFSSKDLKMVYKDAKMTKLFSDYKLALVEADPDKYTLHINMQVPEVISEGQYELNGKMLMMPVMGSGSFVLTYRNVTLDVTFIGKAKTKDGKTYMQLQDVKVIFQPNELKVQVENLFNGNKELSDNFHKFVNENWREIFEDLKDKVWASLGVFFKQTFSKLFDEVPYNEIYTF